MKVKERQAIDTIVENDAVKVTRSARRPERTAPEAKQKADSNSEAADVNVSLASLLAKELNPDQAVKEHREHFERIKALVQSGQYQTPDAEGKEFVARLLQRIDDERQLIAGFVDDGEKT